MYEERRDDDAGWRRTRSGISPVLIALAVVVVLAVIFVVQNREQAQVQLFFWEHRLSVWVVIALSIIVGIVLDRLVSIWLNRRRREH